MPAASAAAEAVARSPAPRAGPRGWRDKYWDRPGRCPVQVRNPGPGRRCDRGSGSSPDDVQGFTARAVAPPRYGSLTAHVLASRKPPQSDERMKNTSGRGLRHS